MNENAYKRAKEYVSKLESKKWDKELGAEGMRAVNERTRQALTQLLQMKENQASRANTNIRPGLLEQRLKTGKTKKTIVDLTQLDPLVRAYETKVRGLQSEMRRGEQEIGFLQTAVQGLVGENEVLREKIEGLIEKKIAVCENSQKYIEHVEQKREALEQQVESLEREKGVELLRVADSLEGFKLELRRKEETLGRFEETAEEGRRNLEESGRREAALVHAKRILEGRVRDMGKVAIERERQLARARDELKGLKEIMSGEERKEKVHQIWGKDQATELEKIKKTGKLRARVDQDRIRELESDIAVVQVERNERDTRILKLNGLLKEMKQVRKRLTAENSEMFAQLKETEASLRAEEGSRQGEQVNFREFTSKLENVLRQRNERIRFLESESRAQATKIKGESLRDIRDHEKEKRVLEEKCRQDQHKAESLDRAGEVKDQVIEGLKNERDFFRRKAESILAEARGLEELRESRDKFEGRCQSYLELNTNLVHRQKELEAENLKIREDFEAKLCEAVSKVGDQTQQNFGGFTEVC